MNGTEPLDTRLGAFQRRALLIGGAGLAVWLLLALTGILPAVSRRVAMGAYLIGYLYILGIALGCLVMLMLHHLAGGNWGSAIRRVTEAASRTLPILALLFIPVLLGVKSLYEWSHADTVAGDELLRHKQPYLNVNAFVVRAVFYFVVWSLLALLLNSWAARQEQSPASVSSRRFRLLSGPGLVFYGLMMTFAAVDWAMSLEPHWFSTIYGVLFMIGQAASGLAFAIAATMFIASRQQPSAGPTTQTLADLGGLMLAFVMLWAYISLSQFLIVWSGNLPEEIPWYIARMRNGWGLIGLSLVVFHFFVPFGLLLMAKVKRDPRMLIRMAVLILIVRAVDLGWIIAPSFSADGHHDGVWVLVLTPVAIAGIGGVWLSLFIGQLRSRSLLPYPAPADDAPHTRTEAAS